MAKSLKINNPAAAAVSTFTDDEPATNKGGRPKKKGETHSRRTNVLFKPSTYEAMQDLAAVDRTSVNHLLNKLAEGYIQENQEKLAKFRKIQEA